MTTTTLRAGLSLCLAWFTLGALAADAPKTISLFNGRDLTGWETVGKGEVQWKYGKAALNPDNPTKLKVAGPGEELVNPLPGMNLLSDASFGDCLVEFEFMTSKSTPGSTTDSNSGIKLMAIYEIQIFDNFGQEKLGKVDCGAVYGETPPKVNACKKPGEWQTMSIDFRAPRFDASGKKTANAKFVKVVLNGQTVQEDVEIAHGTNVSRNKPEHPTGPIYLQGDHGSVAFRSLKVTPLNP